MRRLTWLLAAGLATCPVAGAAEQLRDPYFGEALYYAHQERYLDALERLDTELAQHYRVDEPELDSLHYHVGRAEFSVGDFELHYRMHHRAGRAIRAVLEGDVDEAVRNEAAFRLARIHFQKDQPEDALFALERISGVVPDEISADVEFLRANVYLALGRPGEAAEVLRELQDAKGLEAFSAYNLGIALLQDGQEREAMAQLDRAGKLQGLDQAGLAMRDKANFVRGALLLESEDYGSAQAALERVRLEGPFSNQALLGAGWAHVSAENFERALVPLAMLAEREVTDAAVQEAILALPYAYSRLNVHGRAALLYGEAVEIFGQELDKVDASIRSIREGRFLAALVREEIRLNKDWVIRLRSLPETPETFYLATLMASHDFQTALQNYLDLEDLRKRLVSWERSFDAFEDVIAQRHAYFEPILPELDRQFRELDSQIRLRQAQRAGIDRRLQAMLTAPRPDYLATADERVALETLRELAQRLGAADSPEEAALRARLERLEGLLQWELETRYHERFTQAHENLAALNEVVVAMEAQYQSFVRARQAAMHSYIGYDEQISRLRRRVSGVLEQLQVLMARQGHMLERVAVAELDLRRQRLEAYQNEARYAFADSFDRATKAQAAEDQG
ncbi:lipopolysaccharide assembly protein LapB [Thioalkalivibrio sp. XN279]|uniref:tetratricopeptide repeat protein n=1 Tax=Thioalkalivibrio sp. XN279 TaxID=2714953 RepID=UPI00140C0F86|nr:tetratricopeptide repeat protein [Thioalkalivibrio sp. XN279]NHA14235.1 tetratricopeptide repeat protein [Thioalkalivibrio sp. XN279]